MEATEVLYELRSGWAVPVMVLAVVAVSILWV